MQHAQFGEDNEQIGDAADESQHDDGDEHHCGVALAFTEGQEIAEPRIAADQFADHDTDHRQRRADAQTREQRRQRGRKLDLPEDLRTRGLERAGEIDQVGIE